jgi:carbon monoxide dehydrogenase subunit G
VITINERVLIPYPPDLVWAVISDPSKVVGCIEGSEIRTYHDDGSFDAQLAVKFAAIKVSFAARANLELEEKERIGRLDARGSDTRGSTRVTCQASFAVQPETDGSVVDIDGTVELNGHLASLVTTGAGVVVSRMTRAFAVRLTAVCAELNAAVPVPSMVATLAAPEIAVASTPAVAVPVPPPAVLAPAEEPRWRRVLAAVSGGVHRLLRLVRNRLRAPVPGFADSESTSPNTEKEVQAWQG